MSRLKILFLRYLKILQESESNPVFPLAGVRVPTKGLLGKLVVFFRNSPQEYLYYEDLLVKADAYLEEYIVTTLKRAHAAGILECIPVDDTVSIKAGVNINQTLLDADYEAAKLLASPFMEGGYLA